MSSHAGHGAAGSTPIGVAMIAVMVVAMMAPGAGPMLRYVRTRALRRRWWAAPTVLTAYLGLWIGVGLTVAALLPGSWSRATVVVALAVAAAWQLTPIKRWAAAACDRPRPLALRGPAATASELRFGCHQGLACVVSCGPAMVPMLAGAGPMILLMVVGTVVTTGERLTARPRAARRIGAGLLATTAAVVALGA